MTVHDFAVVLAKEAGKIILAASTTILAANDSEVQFSEKTNGGIPGDATKC